MSERIVTWGRLTSILASGYRPVGWLGVWRPATTRGKRKSSFTMENTTCPFLPASESTARSDAMTVPAGLFSCTLTYNEMPLIFIIRQSN